MKYFVSFPTEDGGTIAVSMHDIRKIEGRKGEATCVSASTDYEGGLDTIRTPLSVEAVINKIQRQAAQYERMLNRRHPED